MKRLVLALLLAPGIASAGLVIVDTKPVPPVQAAQQVKGALPFAQPVSTSGKETAARPPEVVKAPVQDASAKLIQKVEVPKAEAVKSVPAPVLVPAPKPAPTWTLTAGRTVGKELQGWGEKAGWKVIWNLPKDWAVPATTTFPGDFKTAASSVIKNLSANGAIISAKFFDGNNTVVVAGPGVASQ